MYIHVRTHKKAVFSDCYFFYHKSFVYLFLLSRKALKIDVSWSLFLFKLLKKIQDDCYLFLTLMTITSYSI